MVICVEQIHLLLGQLEGRNTQPKTQHIPMIEQRRQRVGTKNQRIKWGEECVDAKVRDQ